MAARPNRPMRQERGTSDPRRNRSISCQLPLALWTRLIGEAERRQVPYRTVVVEALDAYLPSASEL